LFIVVTLGVVVGVVEFISLPAMGGVVGMGLPVQELSDTNNQPNKTCHLLNNLYQSVATSHPWWSLHHQFQFLPPSVFAPPVSYFAPSVFALPVFHNWLPSVVLCCQFHIL